MELTDREESMEELYRQYAETAVLARLAAGRPPVRGRGLLPAPVMVVGEAPGQQEERQGKPFVGPAGKLLREIFRDAEVPWEYCYVTNVVSWRPPANRTPYPYEVQASRHRLESEVELAGPVMVVAAGDVAWRGLTGGELGRFGDARFGWHELHGRRLLALPHPSYLLHLKDPAERGRWRLAAVSALAQALPQQAQA